VGLVQDPDQFRADPDPTFHSAAENIHNFLAQIDQFLVGTGTGTYEYLGMFRIFNI